MQDIVFIFFKAIILAEEKHMPPRLESGTTNKWSTKPVKRPFVSIPEAKKMPIKNSASVLSSFVHRYKRER